MSEITYDEKEELITKIAGLLMTGDQMGLGEYTECYDTATNIVGEWIDGNHITVIA